MLAQIDWSLGRFGDRRLDKGGRRSVVCMVVGRTSAFVGLQASVPDKMRFCRFLANEGVTES